MIVVVLICLVALLGIKNKKYGICMALNLLCITILNIVLKNIFERPRPEGYRLIAETGFSFPSGHSMVSMAFYGYIIYLVYKKVDNIYLKWGICSIISMLIICIGISRIYLGVHYASDVLAGFYISILYLTIYISCTKKYLNIEKRRG